MNLHSDAVLFPRLLTAAAHVLGDRTRDQVGRRAAMTVGEVESGFVRAQLAYERIANHFLGKPVSTTLSLAPSGQVSLNLREVDGTVRFPRILYQEWQELHPKACRFSYRRYLACIQTLERVVLAHALAGVDVSAPEYLSGIELTLRKTVDNS